MFLHEIAPKTDFRYLNILNTYNMATIQELACAKYLDEIFQFAKNPQTKEKWIEGSWKDVRNRKMPWIQIPNTPLGYPNWNYSDIDIIKKSDIYNAFWRLVWIIEYKGNDDNNYSISDSFEHLLNCIVLKEECNSVDMRYCLGSYEFFCRAIMQCYGKYHVDNPRDEKKAPTAEEYENNAYSGNPYANETYTDENGKTHTLNNHQAHVANMRKVRNNLTHNDLSFLRDKKANREFLKYELFALVLLTFDLMNGESDMDQEFILHEIAKKKDHTINVEIQIGKDLSDWEQIGVFGTRNADEEPVWIIDRKNPEARSFKAQYFKEYYFRIKHKGQYNWKFGGGEPFIPNQWAMGDALRITLVPSEENIIDYEERLVDDQTRYKIHYDDYVEEHMNQLPATRADLKELEQNLKGGEDSIKAYIAQINERLIPLSDMLKIQKEQETNIEHLAEDNKNLENLIIKLNKSFSQFRKDNNIVQFKESINKSCEDLEVLDEIVLSHDLRFKGIEDELSKVKENTGSIKEILKAMPYTITAVFIVLAVIVAFNRPWCYKITEWWLSMPVIAQGATVAGILMAFYGLVFSMYKLKVKSWTWCLPVFAAIAMGTMVWKMPAYTLEGLRNRMVDEHATFDEDLYLMAHNLGDNDAAYWCAERIEKNLLKEVKNAGSDSSLSVMANSDLPAKACKYYRLAKDRYENTLAGGSIDATMAYRLAMMYLTGKGGEFDRDKATRYASQAQSHPMGAALYAYCCYQAGDMQEMRSQMKLIETGRVGNKEDILYNLLKVLDEIDEIRNTDMTGKDITFLKQKASDCIDKICEWESIIGRNPFLSVEFMNLMGSGIQTADGQALVPRSFYGAYTLLANCSIEFNSPALQYDAGDLFLTFHVYETAELYFLTAWHNGLWDAAVKLVEMADLLCPDDKKPEWYEDAHSVLEANWTGEVSSYLWKAKTFFMSNEISEAEHQLDMAIELFKTQSKFKSFYASKNWWASIATACLNTNNFQKAYEIAMKELVDSTVNHGFEYYLLANQYAKGYGVEKDLHKADSLLQIAIDSACHEARFTSMCLKQLTGVTLNDDLEELSKTDDRAKDIKLFYYNSIDLLNYYLPGKSLAEPLSNSDYERIAGPTYDRNRPMYAYVLQEVKRGEATKYFRKNSKEFDVEKYLNLLSEIFVLLDDNIAANCHNISRATINNMADMVYTMTEMMAVSNLVYTQNEGVAASNHSLTDIELGIINLFSLVVNTDTEIGLWTAKSIYEYLGKSETFCLKKELLKSYPHLMEAKEPSEMEIFMPEPWLL